MSESTENIYTINALCGIATASPQISQFSHNCSEIKFIIEKDLSESAVVIIASIDGNVSAISEGEFLEKTYDAEKKETTLRWHPTGEITAQSGCVIYQIIACSTCDENNVIWYSKEGRLIVTDSIDTTDMSAALVGSYPNLVMQILTKVVAAENLCTGLSDTKVDKEDGRGLSDNNFSNEDKSVLQKAVSDIDEIRSFIPSVDQTYGMESTNPQSGVAVAEAVAGIVNSAPETLNTLGELATALGNDPNFATTIMTILGNKIDKEIGKGLSTLDYTSSDRERFITSSDKIDFHTGNSDNPHNVTKAQLGLDKADNTSDMEKPISVAVADALLTKVDKVGGKSLSTEDYTTEEKEKLAGLYNYDDGNIVMRIEDLEQGKLDAPIMYSENEESWVQVFNSVPGRIGHTLSYPVLTLSVTDESTDDEIPTAKSVWSVIDDRFYGLDARMDSADISLSGKIGKSSIATSVSELNFASDEKVPSEKATCIAIDNVATYAYDKAQDALSSAKEYTDNKVGDIETALDGIIAHANTLIGGDSV